MGWFKPKQRDDAEQLRQRLQAARDRAAADRGNLRLTLDDFLEKPSEERLPAPYEERIDEAMGLAAEPDRALDGHEAVAEPDGALDGHEAVAEPAPPAKEAVEPAPADIAAAAAALEKLERYAALLREQDVESPPDAEDAKSWK
ncbi:MAG TPA: hypothetical protein VII57_02945 [Dehalococcoidia bacterium]